MLLYLDNCCFNRPFDDQNQIRIKIETEAKLFIQDKIIAGDFFLAWSYILDYENSENPFLDRRETIANWKKYAIIDTSENEAILKVANELFGIGMKAKDTLHVACSISMQCDFFITTDRFILKKMINFEGIVVVSPIEFINYLNL